jgi:predicted GNAT family acetyltransferase
MTSCFIDLHILENRAIVEKEKQSDLKIIESCPIVQHRAKVQEWTKVNIQEINSL